VLQPKFKGHFVQAILQAGAETSHGITADYDGEEQTGFGLSQERQFTMAVAGVRRVRGRFWNRCDILKSAFKKAGFPMPAKRLSLHGTGTRPAAAVDEKRREVKCGPYFFAQLVF